MPTTPRCARAAAAVLALALAAGPAAAQQAPTTANAPGSGPVVTLEPPAGALVATGPQADLTLLYTGDVIGFVDPCG